MTSEPIDWTARPLRTRTRDFLIGILALLVAGPLAVLAWFGVMIGIGMGVTSGFEYLFGVPDPNTPTAYFVVGIGTVIVLGLLAWEYRNIIGFFEVVGAFIVALLRGHIRD